MWQTAQTNRSKIMFMIYISFMFSNSDYLNHIYHLTFGIIQEVSSSVHFKIKRNSASYRIKDYISKNRSQIFIYHVGI